MREELTELVRSRPAGPFLFVGSGFSRRYLGLEDWRGLLGRFCLTGKPLEYYLAAADGDLPEAAALLAKEFNDFWWSSADFRSYAVRDKSKIEDSTSALRLEISRYLETLDQSVAKNSEYAEEIDLLSGLNVDGVITTNWDRFLEQIFPGYEVYIGQKELLFSNPQQIAEIYKIHGCCTRPSSLVLTGDDYREFKERNAYLAAKLMTIFVEHPVVFIGYSLVDPNIASLLKAVSLCIGRDQVDKLRRNLIFVQRVKEGEKSGISDTYQTIDGVQIPLVVARTNDFRPIYQALGEVRRKIPARILRYCKEQLYELVTSQEPEKRICLVDMDEIERRREIEFLVGVGVATEKQSAEEGQVGKVGYAALGADDLFRDVLHEDQDYDPRAILEYVVKRAGANTSNVPVFKYLREAGIGNAQEYERSGLQLDKWVKRDFKDFRVRAYQPGFFKRRHLSMKELVEQCTPQNASGYIPWLAKEKLDVDQLREFLLANEAKLFGRNNYQSNFRKVATLYDKLRWGW